jgi:Icc protein
MGSIWRLVRLGSRWLGKSGYISQLIDDANLHLADHVDFAVLPGDNANHATREQFQKIANAASRLRDLTPGGDEIEASPELR